MNSQSPKPCKDCGGTRHKHYARCEACQKAFWRGVRVQPDTSDSKPTPSKPKAAPPVWDSEQAPNPRRYAAWGWVLDVLADVRYGRGEERA